jgi:hypothetical protein
MSADYTIGRVNFGPRDSYTTLGQLIDEIGAQEELVEDLCVFTGNLLTEVYDLNDTLSDIKSGVYEL